jgi:hypothetical protein
MHSAVALTVLLLVHDINDPFSEWMKSLTRPDFDGPCCGPSDQYYPESYWQNDDGSFEVTVNGVNIHVPANKVIWDRVNPTGRGVLFMSKMFYNTPVLNSKIEPIIYCFIAASGV